jgi:cellulose synthase (UDP-forming)
LNGAYVSSTPLPHSDNVSTTLDTVVPIPVVDLRPFSNTLTFKFAFQTIHAGHCNDATPLNLQGVILKNSSIDISGLSHSTVLPNLELFANAGYPFTRFADLAETAVVLPSQPTAEELEIFLTLMGHFGAQTGVPALNVGVTDAGGIVSDGAKDYLVLGTAQDSPALKTLDASLPVGIDPGGLRVRDTGSLFTRIQTAWLRLRGVKSPAQSVLDASGSLPDTLIEGAEWPSGSNRSVVAVILRDPAASSGFLTALLAGSQSSAIAQSVSVLRGGQFSSYRIGDRTYRVGEASTLLRITVVLQERPWLIAVISVVFCFLLATLLQPILARRAHLRLHDES